MHLFSYFYVVAGVTLYKLIKVMKLKAYLLLQKSETQLASLTDNLSNIGTLNSLGTDSIITGTGTTGDTTILTFGTHITTGTSLVSGEGLIVGILTFVAIALGVILDRKLSQNLDQESDETENE